MSVKKNISLCKHIHENAQQVPLRLIYFYINIIENLNVKLSHVHLYWFRQLIINTYIILFFYLNFVPRVDVGL